MGVPLIFNMRDGLLQIKSGSVISMPADGAWPKHTTRHPPVAIQNGFETGKLTMWEAACLEDEK